MRNREIWTCCLFVAACCGCCTEETAQPSWDSGRTRFDLIEAVVSSGQELDEWREVSKSAFDGIEYRYLRESSFAVLDANDLEAECGLKGLGATFSGKTVVVVRATYMMAEPLGFQVWWDDGKLVVVHTAVGRRFEPKRTALIVAVPEVPQESLCYSNVVE